MFTLLMTWSPDQSLQSYNIIYVYYSSNMVPFCLSQSGLMLFFIEQKIAS